MSTRTIEISTQRFVAAHGKSPRGFGSWAFFPKGDERIEAAIWCHAVNYTEARKRAQQQAAARGIVSLVLGS
jgi:hypothetical protein